MKFRRGVVIRATMRPAVAGPKKPRSNEGSTGVGVSSGTERVDAKQPSTTGIPRSRDAMRNEGMRVPIAWANARTTNDRIELCVERYVRYVAVHQSANPTLPHINFCRPASFGYMDSYRQVSNAYTH